MKKIIISFSIALGLLVSQGAYAAKGITSSYWHLLRQEPTSVPFLFSCEYLRAIYINGALVGQETSKLNAWGGCLQLIKPVDMPVS